MSVSMTKKITTYHEPLAQAVAPLKGQEISQARIEEVYAAAFPDSPDDIKWLRGADHSSNHTNEGPCECSKTQKALFKRVGLGLYLVLGGRGRQIYDLPVWQLIIKRMLPELAIEGDKTFTRAEAVAWFVRRYPRINKTTVGDHLVTLSTNDPSRVDHKAGDSKDILFRVESGVYRLYRRGEDQAPIYAKPAMPPTPAPRPPYLPSSADRRTWTLRAVTDRTGQGAFKAMLVECFTCKCMITGCAISEVIEAAHISPFRGLDDDHVQNGLLLRADIHTLFDRHLIGVHPDTLRVELHPGITAEYGSACEAKLLNTVVSQPGRPALELQYAKFQERLGRPVAI